VYIYFAPIFFFFGLLLLLLQESTEILLAITQILNCFVLVELSRQNVVSDNALHGIFLCDGTLTTHGAALPAGIRRHICTILFASFC
jgi:hypothetical protein